MFRPCAIVLDFDGVIADSEVAANRALAESLTAIGLPTSFDDCLRDYCGHNWGDTQRRIEGRLGAALPETFHADRRARWLRFERDLGSVPGIDAFLAATAHLPRAIASSSSAEYIHATLDGFALAHHFGDHVYSAAAMTRGKPHPDIYLAAAKGLGIDAELCLAIEDSPTGASAAVAAGMHVVGLIAGGHITDRKSHAAALWQVGVHRIASTFAEIALS